MTGAEWGVLAGGMTAIAAVNWWFFGAQERGVQGQQVTIEVKGGYSPATIRVKAGEPVRLIFDRQETNSCSEEVVFPDFSVRRFLPPNEKTVVELRPEKPGTYEFTCGMSMLRGRIVAE